MMSITTAQIRGARGILNWSQSDLAERTGISATSIGSIENGQSTPRATTIKTIEKSFEDAGIEFLPGEGMRKKNVSVDILRGKSGFRRFSHDVYDSMENDSREILQAYVDDTKFADWLGEEAYPHVKRMETLKDLRFKILQKEGDNYFPAKNYAEYRWIPASQFLAVPFMVYADKMAIILFDLEPAIITLNYPIIAEAYRLQFYAIWGSALVPPKNLIEESSIPEKYKHQKIAGR